VFDKVQLLHADFGLVMAEGGKIPHQNRLCFFVTFFAQAKKVNGTIIVVFLQRTDKACLVSAFYDSLSLPVRHATSVACYCNFLNARIIVVPVPGSLFTEIDA